MGPTETDIRAALARLDDPETGGDPVAAGRVRAIGIAGGHVRAVVEGGPALEPLRAAAEAALTALPGVESVSIRRVEPPAPARRRPDPPRRLSGIDRIIAIASGKGGVGKSTLAANLAVALAAMGRRTGLLDADIHGPSQPLMMGETRAPASPDGTRLSPRSVHGVAFISAGLITRPGDALAWRGPMVSGALNKLLTETDWGRLDTLIVDLPPGTGDVSLSLIQKTRISGAIVVSTPQDVALIDARRALDMLARLGVPALGLVENMAGFACPECGLVSHPFGAGGAEAEAARRGLPFLGRIPLDLGTRIASDAGRPVVLAEPEGAPAQAFRALAARLVAGGMG